MFTDPVEIAHTTVHRVFAQRGASEAKCIGAIGYRKHFEREGEFDRLFIHTCQAVAPYFPGSDTAIMNITVFKLHNSTWESRYYNMSHGNSTLYSEEKRSGTTDQGTVRIELKGTITYNLALHCPGPVSAAPLPAASTSSGALTSSQVQSDDVYV